MLLVVNPHAAAVTPRLRQIVLSALKGRYEVQALDTQAPGDAIELCRRAAEEHCEVVVTLGGDGTVNEAANGLCGSNTPLSCLPGGSANVFGKIIGVPADPIDATERLLGLADAWSQRAVDVGVVNGRVFTFASGLGLDAGVVRRVDSNPHLKARFGPWYFSWATVQELMRRYLHAPPLMAVERDDGSVVQAVTTVLQNGPSFTFFGGRPIGLAPACELDSGTLSACVLHRARPSALASIAWRAFSPGRAVVDHRDVTGLPGLSELRVRSTDGRSLPLEVDGDFVGEVLEAHYSVRAKALRLIC